jgi:hypothetical protein
MGILYLLYGYYKVLYDTEIYGVYNMNIEHTSIHTSSSSREDSMSFLRYRKCVRSTIVQLRVLQQYSTRVLAILVPILRVSHSSLRSSNETTSPAAAAAAAAAAAREKQSQF